MADLQKALEWARNNPNDERSKKLLDAVASGKITQDSVKAKQIQEEHKQLGFLETLVNKAGERADKVSQIQNSNQTTGSKTLQTFGQGAGLVADVVGEGVSRVARAVTPDFIEKPIVSAFNKGVETVAGSQPVQNAVGYYKRFKEANPEMAGNVEAIGNVVDLGASLTGAGVGTKVAGKAALKAGEKTLETTGKVVEKTAETAGKVSRFGVSQATGLNPSTIDQILKTPGMFTAKEMAKIDRESIANTVKSALDKRLEALSETGKEYDTIRKGVGKVVVPENTVSDVLGKYGIQVGENGKLITTAESVPLSSGDIASIEGFIKQYGSSQEMSGNAFLNARKALDNMAKWDANKTDVSQRISRDLRQAFDASGKEQLQGLAELDAKYAPEVKLLSGVKKKLLNPDGSLKDTAISTLANLTGKGKEQILARMEKIIPGISEKVNILKSIEDIEHAQGQKVGAYFRGVGGALAGASVSGGTGAIIGAIVASPTIAISMLRNYAKVRNIAKESVEKITSKMKSGASLVGNEAKIFEESLNNASQKMQDRVQKRIQKFLKDPSAGNSIKDISRNIDSEDRDIILKFLDNHYVGGQKNIDVFTKAFDLADAMGFNTKKISPDNLAEILGNVLDAHYSVVNDLMKNGGTINSFM
jgi:hypothetical protein